MYIHQVYYNESQLPKLHPGFIPFNNIPNMDTPYRQFYEYPILKYLQLKYVRDKYDGLWGYVSWRFEEKLKSCRSHLTAKDYCNWIEKNPGYDFYHLNTLSCHLRNFNYNVFEQGEYCHPGMIDFFNRLINLRGWNFDLLNYDPQFSMTCHYYVMTTKTWGDWLTFLDDTLEFVKTDSLLLTYADGDSKHRNNPWCNWAFIAERLITIWVHLNPQVKFLAYK